MSKNILVVAAHPDDEVLGCGGTIARHAATGDKVHILILAEGATAREGGGGEELAALREAAREAAKALGAEPPDFLGLPDNRLDTLPLLDVIKAIEAVIANVRPAVVYTHHAGDLNVDHRIAHQAVLTACRPLPGSSVKSIYAFETVSSTEWMGPAVNDVFRPNRFISIDGQWPAKRRALEAYKMEMRPFPHARSVENVEALARTRGAAVGEPMSEAFVVVREVLA